MQTAKLSKILRQRDPDLRKVVNRLAASKVQEAVDNLYTQGRVVEIADEGQRLLQIATAYCEKPENTLVISPANKERRRINGLIHHPLQKQGKVSYNDYEVMVYVNRQDMTGTERTFANAYVPNEDIVRYNRASKVYGVSPGDYAKVIATNHEKNEVTVRRLDGEEVTYNPTRLSGVSVYRESIRMLAEGDRIQFRAPVAEHRIANGELGTIEVINAALERLKQETEYTVTHGQELYRMVWPQTTIPKAGRVVMNRVLLKRFSFNSSRIRNQKAP